MEATADQHNVLVCPSVRCQCSSVRPSVRPCDANIIYFSKESTYLWFIYSRRCGVVCPFINCSEVAKIERSFDRFYVAAYIFLSNYNLDSIDTKSPRRLSVALSDSPSVRCQHNVRLSVRLSVRLMST